MSKATAVNTSCYIFVWGTLAVVLPLQSWTCWHPAVEIMQKKRSHIWLPALSVPDVGKWRAFLPEWFVEGAAVAPVFSVDSFWDTFPHLCIAVLCVSARLIYRGRDQMKNCVISVFPLKEKCSCEQMRMHVCWVIFAVVSIGFPIICSGTFILVDHETWTWIRLWCLFLVVPLLWFLLLRLSSCTVCRISYEK